MVLTASRQRARFTLFFVVVVAAAMAAACSDSKESDRGPDAAPVEPDDAIRRVVAAVPDSDANRHLVLITNAANFEDAYDVRWPTTDAAISAYNEASLDPVVGLAPTETMRNALTAVANEEPGLDEEFGIDPAAVDVWVTYGEPPDDGELLLGEFDPDATADALADVPFWSDVMEEATHEEQTFYRWGDDHEMLAGGEGFEPTTMRPLAQGMRLFVDDTTALLAKADAVVTTFLDTHNDAADSLGDDEAFGGIGERLAFDGFVSAFLTDQVELDLEGVSDEVRDALDDASGLQNVVAYGAAMGPGDSEGEGADERARVRLVIACATAEDAEANDELFRTNIAEGVSARTGEPWSDHFEVVETEVDDRFLVVELSSDRGRLVLDALFARDTLVVSG
jgi:hypothetical protein